MIFFLISAGGKKVLIRTVKLVYIWPLLAVILVDSPRVPERVDREKGTLRGIRDGIEASLGPTPFFFLWYARCTPEYIIIIRRVVPPGRTGAGFL